MLDVLWLCRPRTLTNRLNIERTVDIGCVYESYATSFFFHPRSYIIATTITSHLLPS